MKQEKIKSLLTKAIPLSYLIGITWFLLHPLISITTGEFHKCRGLYIDENALLHGSFQTPRYHPLGKNQNLNYASICNLISTSSSSSSTATTVSCNDKLEYITIDPNEGFTEIPLEAIALVFMIPSATNTLQKSYYTTLFSFITRISNAPWLAKRIYIISTTKNETLDAFYNDYFHDSTTTTTTTTTIPHLRQVLFVNLSHQLSNKKHIEILPHGQNGALPNLDLVFLVVSIFSSQYKITMHPYSTKLEHILSNQYYDFPSNKYLMKLIDMMTFMYTMIFGPFSHHSNFLQHGIDSLTINTSESVSFLELFQKLETIIRSLSSLHEKLHHSVSQYILPSSDTFVSNGEFIYPAILLLCSLMFRALLLFDQIEKWNGSEIVFVTIIVTILQYLSHNLSWLLCSYLLTISLLFLKKRGNATNIHFLTCLLGIYSLAPLLMMNYSFVMFSLIFLSPLLSSSVLSSRKECSLWEKTLNIVVFITLLAYSSVPLLFMNQSTFLQRIYLSLHYISFLIFFL